MCLSPRFGLPTHSLVLFSLSEANADSYLSSNQYLIAELRQKTPSQDNLMLTDEETHQNLSLIVP